MDWKVSLGLDHTNGGTVFRRHPLNQWKQRCWAWDQVLLKPTSHESCTSDWPTVSGHGDVGEDVSDSGQLGRSPCHDQGCQLGVQFPGTGVPRSMAKGTDSCTGLCNWSSKMIRNVKTTFTHICFVTDNSHRFNSAGSWAEESRAGKHAIISR